jgi:hypothetical protein
MLDTLRVASENCTLIAFYRHMLIRIDGDGTHWAGHLTQLTAHTFGFIYAEYTAAIAADGMSRTHCLTISFFTLLTEDRNRTHDFIVNSTDHPDTGFDRISLSLVNQAADSFTYSAALAFGWI